MSKNYHEIKDRHAKTIDELITKHKGFFAFSDSQLIEGMAKININDRKELTSLSMGLILPKIEAKPFLDNMEQADKDYKKELKEAREAKDEAILYELNNHESFYRGNMDDVFDMFDGIYTKDEIKAVYKKFVNKEHEACDRLNTNVND